MWKLRFAGVGPRGKPVGADGGGGVGKLAQQAGRDEVVEAVVVGVGEGGFAAARITVGEKHTFESGVRIRNDVESLSGRIVGEGSVGRSDGDKGRVRDR